MMIEKKVIFSFLIALVALITLVIATTGNLLGTVSLPGNGNCAVGGTFDGTYYLTMQGELGCMGNQLQIYQPPIGGNGNATLIATKNLVDVSNNSVSISALAWDAGRGLVWGAYDDKVYLIDIGNPTTNGDALTILQFNAGVGGINLVDGLAYDAGDDTIYYSPDVDCNVYHFSANGTLLNSITPKNATGQADCRISGVVVGTNNTLYVGRDGAAEIRRIDKTTGNYISQFATTSGRTEDLTCDPVTYSPKEAILSKDAYRGLYEAFEVELGTCPLQSCEDDDSDGVCNDEDLCPQTHKDEPVDQYGCDIIQFCSKFSCGSICFFADWKDNEKGKIFPNDCTVAVVENEGNLEQPICVPTEFSEMCAN